jgi:hypothetical protein
LSATFNEHIRSRIRDRIQGAFEAARAQGATGRVAPKTENRNKVVDSLTTKQPHIPHYTEADARSFQLRGDTLIGAVQSQLHRHKSYSYYAGDLEKKYTAEEVIADALQPAKTESKKERKKA